ncbi:MAG: ribonuclease H-like domain-containing protein [Acidobacteria bacterium]|jgi:ribonuclease HI|nr:ribonuclease H-like domain-containing protein [Acidobacteriota bacterium]
MDIETTTVKPSGNLKHTFNVDASFDFKRRVAGIGIVIHETDQPRKKGPIIAEISELHNNIPPGEIEKFAVFRALEIASERNYQILHIRSDYNHMRRKLKEDHEAGIGHEQDDLHGQVLRYAQKFTEVKFLYCLRRKNVMAHRLARKAVKESLPPGNDIKIDFEFSEWDNEWDEYWDKY